MLAEDLPPREDLFRRNQAIDACIRSLIAYTNDEGGSGVTHGCAAIVRIFAELDRYQPPHHVGTTNRRIFGPEDGVGDFSMVRGTLWPGGGADRQIGRAHV